MILAGILWIVGSCLYSIGVQKMGITSLIQLFVGFWFLIGGLALRNRQKCEYCGNVIARQAIVCPKCQRSLGKTEGR